MSAQAAAEFTFELESVKPFSPPPSEPSADNGEQA